MERWHFLRIQTDMLCILGRYFPSDAKSHLPGYILLLPMERELDEIGGRAKSLVPQKVMSKSKYQLIVRNAEGFATAAKALMGKTTVKIEDS